MDRQNLKRHTKYRTVRQLKEIHSSEDGEHSSYWKTDEELSGENSVDKNETAPKTAPQSESES